MFKIFNEDVLLRMTLREMKSGTVGKRYRVVNYVLASGDQEIILHIAEIPNNDSTTSADESLRQPFLSISLQEAGKCYLVNPSECGTPEFGNSSLTLSDYLTKVCFRLKSLWPASDQARTTILDLWLTASTTPPPPDGSEKQRHRMFFSGKESGLHRFLGGILNSLCLSFGTKNQHGKENVNKWLVLARQWLKLDSFCTSVSPDTSVQQFFSQLEQDLASDQSLWISKTDDSFIQAIDWKQIQLFPDPKPASFFKELCRAGAEAQTVTANAPNGEVSIIPYLERSLEIHWARVLKETDFSKRLFPYGDAEDLQATVHVQNRPPMDSISRKSVHSNCAWYAFDACGLDICLPFLARKTLASEKETFFLRLSIRAVNTSARLKAVLRPLLKLLCFHLSDVKWAVAEYFRRKTIIIVAGESLVFDDEKGLKAWLPSAGDPEVELKTQLLGMTWLRTGPPRLRQSDNDSQVTTIIAKWLLGLTGVGGFTPPPIPRTKRATGAVATMGNLTDPLQVFQSISLDSRSHSRLRSWLSHAVAWPSGFGRYIKRFWRTVKRSKLLILLSLLFCGAITATALHGLFSPQPTTLEEYGLKDSDAKIPSTCAEVDVADFQEEIAEDKRPREDSPNDQPTIEKPSPSSFQSQREQQSTLPPPVEKAPSVPVETVKPADTIETAESAEPTISSAPTRPTESAESTESTGPISPPAPAPPGQVPSISEEKKDFPTQLRLLYKAHKNVPERVEQIHRLCMYIKQSHPAKTRGNGSLAEDYLQTITSLYENLHKNGRKRKISFTIVGQDAGSIRWRLWEREATDDNLLADSDGFVTLNEESSDSKSLEYAHTSEKITIDLFKNRSLVFQIEEKTGVKSRQDVWKLSPYTMPRINVITTAGKKYRVEFNYFNPIRTVLSLMEKTARIEAELFHNDK